MLRKILYFTTILLVVTLFLNISSYATDIVMDLNTTTSNTVESNNSIAPDTNTVDNTTIGYEDSTTDITEDTYTPYEDSTTITTTDYDDGAELSISNIINIILISVGVVLILLGIAIILKLK